MLTEQVGIHKTNLLWTKDPLDCDGRPMFMAPLPRGVKEYSHNDLETFLGTSFMLKKNTRYPPPPTLKGTAVNSEMCLCELGVYVKVKFIHTKH